MTTRTTLLLAASLLAGSAVYAQEKAKEKPASAPPVVQKDTAPSAKVAPKVKTPSRASEKTEVIEKKAKHKVKAGSIPPPPPPPPQLPPPPPPPPKKNV